MMFYVLLIILLFLFIVYPLIVFYFLYKKSISKEIFKAKFDLSYDCKICAFFHPNCNGGGGGERVLWEGIKVIQEKFPKIFCIIYCNQIDSSDEEILQNVNTMFSIQIKLPIAFVRLKYCRFLDADKYKRFTMIGQSLGSVIVALEAIIRSVPDIYFDTVGYAFTIPVFKVLALCRTAAYVHYPTISKDMLTTVAEGSTSFNNSAVISNSKFYTNVKLHYYRSFALFYGLVGKAADCVMVNSSWTKAHIMSLWGGKVHLVYPPCDVTKILSNTECITRSDKRRPWIISVGQFRAEKNHLLQLQSFKYYLDNYMTRLHRSYENDVKLVLIGGCRNVEDAERIKWLQGKCAELGIEDSVKFKCNINHKEMLKCFEDGLIGIHTMTNEHFGIAIVECMAAGLITVANDSGGPKLDIINNNINGFLASTCEDYGKIFDKIFSKSSEYWNQIRIDAKHKSLTFSSEEFALSFSHSVKEVLSL